MIPKCNKVSLYGFVNEVLDELLKDDSFKEVKQEYDKKKMKEIFEKCLTNHWFYDIMLR